jgi:hypothetical protein
MPLPRQDARHLQADSGSEVINAITWKSFHPWRSDGLRTDQFSLMRFLPCAMASALVEPRTAFNVQQDFPLLNSTFTIKYGQSTKKRFT